MDHSEMGLTETKPKWSQSHAIFRLQMFPIRV